MRGRHGADARAESEWWDAALAGDTDEPHPTHGHNVSVRIRDGVAVLSGRLQQPGERWELVRQAKARVGRGLRDVDASRLHLADQTSREGIFDQTLIASYPDAATAHRATRFILKHLSVPPRRHAVIAPGTDGTPGEVPPEYAGDVKRRLDRGEAVLVMRVDETAAFEVRELMEEETRSSWTVAAPPELAATTRPQGATPQR